MSTIPPSKRFDTNEFLKPLGRSLVFVANEAGEAAKNDPALAMRLAATGLEDMILTGVNPDVVAFTSKTMVPVVRTGLLALNTARCIQTFRDPASTWGDKTMDSIRVVSDTVGFLGGMAMLFTPQYAALGARLMGGAYAVDVVSHAFRGLTHAAERVQVWQAEANQNEDPPPPPAPPKTLLESPRQLDLWNKTR